MLRRTRRLSIAVALAAIASLASNPASAHDPWDHLPIARSLPLPDSTASAQPGEQVGALALDPIVCPTTPRAGSDRADVIDDYQVHPVYLLPKDAPKDWAYDTNGTFQCSLRAADRWFDEQSGGYTWRWDTFLHTVTNPSTGATTTVEAIDVTFIRSAKTSAQLGDDLGVLADEIALYGLSRPKKRYLIYAEVTSGACGVGYYPTQGTNVAVDGKYSAVFMRANSACGARAFGTPGAPSYSEVIALQEMIHNDGMVPPTAVHGCGPPPGSTFGHVCTAHVGALAGNLDPESVDVMFPFVGRPLSQKRLDPGNDDYFDTPLLFRDLVNGLYLNKPAA